MLLIVANPMIERLRLPERQSRPPQKFVGLTGCKSFPALQNPGQSVIRQWPYHGMNVIRHHHPSPQLVTFFRKETESVGDEVRNLRASKPALTATAVKIALQLAVIIPLNGFQRILLRRWSAPCLRFILLRLEAGLSLSPLGLDFEHYLLRERIGEAERDEISRTFPLYVRQISTRMNSGTQRVRRLRFHACSPQLVTHTLNTRVSFLRKHAGRIAMTARPALQRPFCLSGPSPKPRPHIRIRPQFWSAEGVAQTCSLLYRRFVICGRPDSLRMPDCSCALPTASRRYSRLKICVTPVGPFFSGWFFLMSSRGQDSN